MIHKYKEPKELVSPLYEIQQHMMPRSYEMNISDHHLDLIISKYWTDFNLDKTNETNIGYTNEQRLNLRESIRQLVTDIINKNIPQDFTIKDI